MLSRIVKLAVRSFVNGPAKSWIFTSGALGVLRLVRKQTGRREVLDLSRTKPGDKIIIEHLPITHKEQIHNFKVAKKADKQAAKAATKKAKRERRLAGRS